MEEDFVDKDDNIIEEETFVIKKAEIPRVLLCTLSDDKEHQNNFVATTNTENLKHKVSYKV